MADTEQTDSAAIAAAAATTATNSGNSGSEPAGTGTTTEPPSTPPPPQTSSTEEAEAKKKIDILLKAVGDAPIMKTRKWAVEKSRTIQALAQFIKKFLKLDSAEQLFIYVNQSFAPSPDQEVGSLYDCFGSDGKLVLHYCKSQAWG
ncbi:ubiquitin-like protein ATG12 [Latimeria chalumnae]|uniref:Ubiquitin-like protein ATG12 n=1 Tax=Latimeria chalumnae TaxID=7897 RepID=H2ZVM5_LATCH|nr:PREDICTED: ubiquitin-like protein ATG12 [Latimeria chalumnae]|eukprot:XP_006011318.1 PREDICTED: ubiquitin-like protein ATG12 [Latimeria chalumnae]